MGIHHTANSILAGHMENHFGREDLLIKAAPFVNMVVQAALNFNKNVDIPRRLGKVYLTQNEWVRLRKLQQDAGFKTMEGFLQSLLKRIVS